MWCRQGHLDAWGGGQYGLEGSSPHAGVLLRPLLSPCRLRAAPCGLCVNLPQSGWVLSDTTWKLTALLKAGLGAGTVLLLLHLPGRAVSGQAWFKGRQHIRSLDRSCGKDCAAVSPITQWLCFSYLLLLNKPPPRTQRLKTTISYHLSWFSG